MTPRRRRERERGKGVEREKAHSPTIGGNIRRSRPEDEQTREPPSIETQTRKESTGASRERERRSAPSSTPPRATASHRGIYRVYTAPRGGGSRSDFRFTSRLVSSATLASVVRSSLPITPLLRRGRTVFCLPRPWVRRFVFPRPPPRRPRPFAPPRPASRSGTPRRRRIPTDTAPRRTRWTGVERDVTRNTYVCANA